MNDLMAILRIICLILVENQRFFFTDERMCTFHDNEIINHVVQNFQPIRQKLEFIVENKPVDDLPFSG